MTGKLDQILVFKTNISTEDDHLSVKTVLDGHSHIQQWSVDMQDVDCVLRVVSPVLRHEDVIQLIRKQGYHCTELQ